MENKITHYKDPVTGESYKVVPPEKLEGRDYGSKKNFERLVEEIEVINGRVQIKIGNGEIVLI